MNEPKASSCIQLHCQCKIQPMATASCPLDVHCIRKPVCDCHNLDVAVALSARVCRYDAALGVRLTCSNPPRAGLHQVGGQRPKD